MGLVLVSIRASSLGATRPAGAVTLGLMEDHMNHCVVDVARLVRS